MSGPDAIGGLSIYETQTALIQAAADLFVRTCAAATARGTCSVALSGGSTPIPFHQLLASPTYRDKIDWSRIEWYWGDDRCVPPDDPESNYRMARETLLDAVPAPPDHIHRMRTELPPAEAAAAYEQEIQRGFDLSQGQFPRFDFVLLGMGPDGHTASLFPHTAALSVRDKIVVANAVPQLNTQRVTLTAPAINSAATILFLIEGANKADSLYEVLRGARNPDLYPSQLIAPRNGDLLWYVDTAAGARLR